MSIIPKLEYISPIRADQYLQLNIKNRTINQSHVRRLADDMKCGRWENNGETIKFNGSVLLDGQHRLEAVKLSKITVPMLVVRGINHQAHKTIDVGKARTPADALKIHGEKHTTRLGAALKIIDQMDNGYITSKHSKRTSHGELFSVLDRHPDLRKSTGLFLDGKKLLPPAVIVAFHYKFAQKDPTQAYEFFDKLLSGEGLVRGNPIHTLREKLIRNSSSHTKYSRDNIMIFTIIAWNAHRQGKQLLKIYVPSNPGLPSIL